MTYEPRLTWAKYETSPVQTKKGFGYVVSCPERLHLFLPENPVLTDFFAIAGHGKGGWQLLQREGEQIRAKFYNDETGAYDMAYTTPGIDGCVISTDPRDTVELICVGKGVWEIYACIGKLRLV